jgi:hypothetical protein
MPPVVTNLLEFTAEERETFRTLLDLPGMRLEQIVSNGHAVTHGRKACLHAGQAF